MGHCVKHLKDVLNVSFCFGARHVSVVSVLLIVLFWRFDPKVGSHFFKRACPTLGSRILSFLAGGYKFWRGRQYETINVFWFDRSQGSNRLAPTRDDKRLAACLKPLEDLA